MSILKIARMGSPVLQGKAAPVEEPLSPEIQRLIDDMIETMADAGGVGLAAPQVFASLRIVVFFVPALRNGGAAVPLTVLINPELEPLDDTVQTDYEGCLSLPGMTGAVPRFTRLRYWGLDRQGQPLEREAEGFHARVLQHECDHLDGVLYPMRMPDLGTFGFVEETRKALSDPDFDGGE
ncbi:peptide deformylase [Paramagnetospirillum marisnigri]|uniref:Peptide deformylase n=1 Tax=Paramagnetospirillum marisnigri TaxID=1285242 RepID=A0A178MCC5_9PROT|nr:peptide deformylase [Paramagnetospirillum marisnigri]OAN45678.1 peptide deformylase [Paramagnetospirillum marisnigri]OAN45700.1 peptide deformylase [Paramagnetospirillum marisnigri]